MFDNAMHTLSHLGYYKFVHHHHGPKDDDILWHAHDYSGKIHDLHDHRVGDYYDDDAFIQYGNEAHTHDKE